MRKINLLSCILILMAGFLVFYSCSNSHKAGDAKSGEIEKKLVGKWKFLYTDASAELPPSDMVYTFMENKTSVLEFTGEKEEKKRIEGSYKILDDHLQLFKEEKLTKEFQIQFQDENTLKLTEIKTKNSMVLERIQ